MPELPEVESLAEFLREHAVGRPVTAVDVFAFQALKTVDPPVTALRGLTVTGVARHGKFLDLDCDGLHLVTHLARAGWLRWHDDLSGAKPVRPGKSPLAVRVRLAPYDEGGGEPGFELTEAGTQKR
ncbi:DNA-formamidopyrimidine glycosylase family protein, partial [Streptomyces anulatus]|uniref:DNA-formamidopyrimidine glycosylase family protein n=1 Tax=Streptomyces anulatus TaxID=1892 RepID=UPI00341255CE